MTHSARFCTSGEGVLVSTLADSVYTPAQGDSVPPKRNKVMINHPHIYSHFSHQRML